MFIGRNKEINKYTSFINGNSDCFLIYGIRRVGKTELIKHCYKLEEKQYIYYQCSENSLKFNLETFQDELIRAGLLREKLNVNSFSQIFYILSLLPYDIHIVIDEYCYLYAYTDSKKIDSDFKNICDDYLNNIHLTLSGSSIKMMRNILEENNPLFGRIKNVIHLKELNYLEASKFYPNKSTYDKIAFYSVFGGSPYILQEIDKDADLKTNIINILLDQEAVGFRYANNILFTDLPLSLNIKEITTILKNGKKTLSEIENLLNVEKNGLTFKKLKALIEMDLIRKVNPINKENNHKLTFYELNNNIIRFFYTFIYSKSSRLEIIDSDAFYDLFIENSLNTFVSKRFEEQARQYISMKKIPNVINIGSYYYDDNINKTNGEFDVAIKYSNETYDIIEVKYYKENNLLSESEMIQEIKQVNNIKDLKINKIIFLSTSGYENNKDYNVIDINDLYSIEE